MYNIERLPFNECTKTKLVFLVEKVLEIVTPTKIVLFGSYARAEYTACSDLDILVLTKNEVPRIIRSELCSVFDENGADLVFYTEEVFNSSDCLLVQNVRRDGVLLWKS